MPYQFKREPLTADEANRLANACQTHEEKLVVWTLLDTGLRVAELAYLTRDHLDWQNHRLMVYGKGGPYGSQTKRRMIPLSSRVQPLLEGHFALYDTFGMVPRTIQRLVKRVANRAHIRRPVTPHVLRHTFSITAMQKGISLEVMREFQQKW
jgi:integrase/recombinase XerD